MFKVFVYGTLKKGQPNHGWFAKDSGYYKLLYEGRTAQKFPLIIATRYNIPFLLQAPGRGHNVQGEVYEVDSKVLANLDVLEEHPDFYVREEHDVVTPEQITEKVWIYMIKSFKPQLLEREFLESYSSEGDHGRSYVGSDMDESSLNDLL